MRKDLIRSWIFRYFSFTFYIQFILFAGKRSKCFRLVSEQRKTEERDFFVLAAREMAREPKNERWGKGRKETLTDKPRDFENPAR